MFNSAPEAGNLLLSALPANVYARLLPKLEKVTLKVSDVLHAPGDRIRHVYFPVDSVVSLVATMEDGSTVEVGMAGMEGMTGAPVFMGDKYQGPVQVVTQIAGGALRMNADALLAEFERGGELQHLLLKYVQAFFALTSQSAACNKLHHVDARLARWLLTAHDRVRGDEFHLTQEYIARMLGVRRSGVTIAAATLQKAGLIEYKRGLIRVTNREGLEAAACECYDVIKKEFNRLLS